MVHPGEALASVGSLDELRESLVAEDCRATPTSSRIPRYCACPARRLHASPLGIRDQEAGRGVSYFHRQAIVPGFSVDPNRGRPLAGDYGPGYEPITAARRQTEGP